MSASTYTSTRAPTAVHWTSVSTVDIGPRTSATSAAPVAVATPDPPAKHSFPFCPFEFRPVKCAMWHNQPVPLQPPVWFTQALPVPRASLLPPLTSAETALWRAEPLNFDIDTEWLLREAGQTL